MRLMILDKWPSFTELDHEAEVAVLCQNNSKFADKSATSVCLVKWSKVGGESPCHCVCSPHIVSFACAISYSYRLTVVVHCVSAM